MWLCKKVFTSHTLPPPPCLFHHALKNQKHLNCYVGVQTAVNAKKKREMSHSQRWEASVAIFDYFKLHYIWDKLKNFYMHEGNKTPHWFIQNQSPNGQKCCINVPIAGCGKTTPRSYTCREKSSTIQMCHFKSKQLKQVSHKARLSQ